MRTRNTAKKGHPGDWMESRRGGVSPAAKMIPLQLPDVDKEVYEPLENQKQSALGEVMEAVRNGKAVIEDAILFCGRFNQDGRLLRESKSKPYKLLHTRGHNEYVKSMRESATEWKGLPAKIEESKRKAEAMRKVRRAISKENFISNSDLGSLNRPDPNQFTEYTPYFSGPFYKQQYFDYFKGHARAFQEWTHNPVAKRIIDTLVQYALGRGFKVVCKNEAYQDKWKEFQSKNKIQFKIRKFWGREYLIYGENFIDVLRWVSVDPSTIWDIICEGYDEYIDNVLYYQQMFQTATQTYAGIPVKGVAGSKDSKIGHYIVRQIPYDQIIHIKTNVTSGEKRGRSVFYSILGWLKRLNDLFNALVLGEQLRASFVWDDTIQGDESDIAAHAGKYAYIPVAPSIFVHNESVTRKPLTPMAGVTGGAGGEIVNSLLALIATSQGFPKDHFNVISTGGSRATAIVGSEPFTKVIEDLQEDFSDLLDRIIEKFCEQNGIVYDESEWKKLFPSVAKDTLADVLKNIAMRESMGWISKKQAAQLAAAECDDDEFDFDEMQKDRAKEMVNSDPNNIHQPPPPPAGRFGLQPKPEDGKNNPIHGDEKSKIKNQHKDL